MLMNTFPHLKIKTLSITKKLVGLFLTVIQMMRTQHLFRIKVLVFTSMLINIFVSNIFQFIFICTNEMAF